MNEPGQASEFDEWADFLLSRPPGSRQRVLNGPAPHSLTPGIDYKLPTLHIYCTQCRTDRYCRGECSSKGQLFGAMGPQPHAAVPLPLTPTDINLVYTCEICRHRLKSYMIRIWDLERRTSSDSQSSAEVEKVGEWPLFAPPTPPRLVTLLGPDRETFLKGRRAEAEGLGVGAFAYYRQILERQKNRLLDEIIRVAKHQGIPESDIRMLVAAKSETQYSKAIESVKDAIPRSLFIKGHNPLTLLYRALSDDLHNASDEECLTVASDIRLILVILSERLAAAMQDQREIDGALSRLLKRGSSK